MAFLDDLKKTVSDTTQGAKNLAEAAKLSSRANELEKKNAGIFEEIGKAYYEKTKAAPEADFADFFTQIEENVKAAEDLKAQVREIKGIVLCPSCGAESKAGEKFCVQCGARVREDEVKEAEAAKYCTTCGEKLEAGAETCPKCGANV